MTPVGLLERSRQTTATFRQDRAVHLEGGLFGPDLLEQLASGDVPGQKPADFGLSRQANLLDEIAEAYRDACDLWQVFRRRLERLPAGKSSTTLTREGWVIPFLGLLGYELRYNQKPYDVNGVTYAVSHRAGENEDAPPVHITGAEQQLGRINPHDPRRLSPHALLQEFLNRTDHLWGIVTNGLTLRLLRDSSYVRRQAYVEFDLQAIFEAEGDSRFADFVLLYRLLHRTRLPRGTVDAHTCWLEQYHQRAIEQGNRARDRLRDGVEECLKILGTGFLRANPDWHPDPKDFYEQLLRLVYRFLFLLVAEERNLLGGSDLYRNHYSISRLRRLIDRREAYTDHEDLWQSLRVLFYLLRNDTPLNDGKPLASFLELPVLDGGLFEPIDLDERTLTNRDLLQAFSYLAYYWDEDARTYRRVNYAALDVEELGSVYESLLDHHPVISNRTFEFATGTERKSTGSYYTPPGLVAQLIHSALEPVIEERLAEVKQLANSEWRMVSSEWRSFPSLILERFYDHLQRLARPGSVAARSGDRKTSLPAHADLPAIGTLRDNQPDTPSSDFDPGQHRGGLGTSLSSRVYPVPPSGERQPHRTGDTSDHLLRNRTGQGGGYSAHPGCPDRPRSSDPQPGAQPPTEEELKSLWANLPFAIRYSLLCEHAILSIRVLDPACGSGHFLLAAARRLGKELARARTGEDEPSPEQVRESIRDVVAHCIYGVDKNPLAVELCKVALWIESQVRGKPLTFLDHRIRCGDSLVGVFDLEVLQRGIPDKAFDPVGDEDKALAREMKNNNRITRRDLEKGQILLFGLGSSGDLTILAEHARLIESIPDDSLETIREKGRRYNELRTEMNHLRTACDLWTASFFQRRTRSLARDARITSQTLCDWLRRGTAPQQAIAQAKALAHDHRFFHWPLEFPEVFSAYSESRPPRGVASRESRVANREIEKPLAARHAPSANCGFDVVLGNPPFMGGLKISGNLGDKYRHWLEIAYAPYRGTADLCAGFYRRVFGLLKPGGRMGMVATNTIGQGDTRESGLAVIVRQGGTISFAQRFLKWPGAANVEVNLVAIHKPHHSPLATHHSPSASRHSPILDGQPVLSISSRLDPEPEEEPKRLKQNEGKAFIGDYVRGIGFVLEPEEAEALIRKDPRNADCLFPYLNGEDLNSHPEQKPSRWVICFHDWELDRAKKYPALLKIVEERVKPERERLRGPGDRRNREYWWQFAAYRDGMRRAIAPLRRVLVRSRIAEMHALVFVPNGWVCNEKTIVFAFDDDYHFALLQSSLHEAWMRRFTSTLRTDVNYAPTDCFDTFPFPAEEYERVASSEWRVEEMPEVFRRAAQAGAEYHEHRRQIMLARQLGLTKTYNLFHNPEWTDADIVRLRELHAEMDNAILACYGWEDLDLSHNFYPNDRGQVRYTISPESRRELLKRLLELNLRVSSHGL
ncbi:MAG: DNA methyltransferase [Thermogutta sp.]